MIGVGKTFPTRTNSPASSSHSSTEWPPSSYLHIHEVATDISVHERPSSAWRHIEMMTNWHASTHTYTQKHAETTQESSGEGRSKGDPLDPDAWSLVWQICITPHFPHNSPYYYAFKWPARSPWISMSRVSSCVSLTRFDACRQPRPLKGGRCWWIFSADAFMSPLKSDAKRHFEE